MVHEINPKTGEHRLRHGTEDGLWAGSKDQLAMLPLNPDTQLVARSGWSGRTVKVLMEVHAYNQLAAKAVMYSQAVSATAIAEKRGEWLAEWSQWSIDLLRKHGLYDTESAWHGAPGGSWPGAHRTRDLLAAALESKRGWVPPALARAYKTTIEQTVKHIQWVLEHTKDGKVSHASLHTALNCLTLPHIYANTKPNPHAGQSALAHVAEVTARDPKAAGRIAKRTAELAAARKAKAGKATRGYSVIADWGLKKAKAKPRR